LAGYPRFVPRLLDRRDIGLCRNHRQAHSLSHYGPAFIMTQRSGKSKHVLSTVSVAMLASVAFYAGALAASMNCERLASISLPNTTITLAQSYAPGQTVSGTIIAPVGLCRVASTVKPSSDSDIKFEVWIPTDGSWNGKYEQLAMADSPAQSGWHS